MQQQSDYLTCPLSPHPQGRQCREWNSKDGDGDGDDDDDSNISCLSTGITYTYVCVFFMLQSKLELAFTMNIITESFPFELSNSI